MKGRVRVKDRTLDPSRPDVPINKGDFVVGDFDNEFVLTFSLASEAKQGSLLGNGPPFYKGTQSLVLEVIKTPESFYSSGFSKVLLPSGLVGWLPNRWLKKT